MEEQKPLITTIRSVPELLERVSSLTKEVEDLKRINDTGINTVQYQKQKIESLTKERQEMVEALRELYKHSPDIPVPMGEFSYSLAKAIKDAGTLLSKFEP